MTVLHVVVVGYNLENFWKETGSTYSIQTRMTSEKGWQLTKSYYALVL